VSCDLENLPIVLIIYPGTFLPFLVFLILPLGILISGILSVVYTVRLIRYKREGKVLQYSRRGLIISLVIFVICVALFFILLFSS